MGRDIKIQANLYYLPQCNIVWCFIENTQVSEKVVHHTIQHQKLVLSCQKSNYQFFVRLIQILSEYMHPLVSGKCLSNKNVKNGHLKSIKGRIQNVGVPPPGWDII